MKNLNKSIGDFGEDLAESYLNSLGYKIIERNFSCKTGELDMIGIDGLYIVFIEVKARYDSSYGMPCEAITASKRFKIYKTAQYYIMVKNLHKENFRFDVVEIVLNKNNREYNIRIIKNAFQI